ncbi:hypothetical protein Fmac_021379 [Flemingia macrophylla]|uniref:Terpene synthase N-terminal domain-containing protein n=1 Tax=Flemingia macrophylla TaxID=520843 RepID=A0ABD1LWQ4_9FABA
MSGSVPVFAKDAKPPSEFRPIADYHPSVWGDHFISYLSPSHVKDLQGNFSERLSSDVEGILSLYEASHVMIHGEEILEEALTFTSTHLKSIVTTLSLFLAAQVNHSLRQSLHKNLPRLEA